MTTTYLHIKNDEVVGFSNSIQNTPEEVIQQFEVTTTEPRAYLGKTRHDILNTSDEDIVQAYAIATEKQFDDQVYEDTKQNLRNDVMSIRLDINFAKEMNESTEALEAKLVEAKQLYSNFIK